MRALRDLSVSSIRLAELDHEDAMAQAGAERMASLRAARIGFRRAFEAWSGVEERGGFMPGDEVVADQLRDAIAKVDEAIAAEVRLHGDPAGL